MPSFIAGPFKIVNISGGTVVFGDTGFVAPKSASKSYSGSGGGFTGDFSFSINGLNYTITADPDLIDDNTNSVT